MKQTEMIALGLAAVAVYLIVNTNKKKAPGSISAANPLQSAAATVAEIFDTAGKTFSNGWRYFNDGTAISPAGDYYQGGQLIWQDPTSPRWAA
jgi:hypothetical protein